MLVAGAGAPVDKFSQKPVSLVNVYRFVVNWNDAEAPDTGDLSWRCLFEIANEEDDPDRIAFSEYHAS
ncbi:MAG: sulfatase, partial [Pseudomonadota bacterium]|nr:sulfatase [Pseudomonadota bacterium]